MLFSGRVTTTRAVTGQACGLTSIRAVVEDKSMQPALHLAAAWVVLFTCASVQADTPCDLHTAECAPPRHGLLPLTECFDYGEKGLEWDSPCSETALWVGLRFQTRIDSYSGDLSTVEDLVSGGGETFDLRRGRLKGGGTLFWDWFEVYSEYDWRSDTLLDYRATATYDDWLAFRVGQWKSEYNRERVDSSGKQQLVERSLSNYWFTVDRQRGLAVSARLFKGTKIDSKAWVEYLSGQGRGGRFSK